MNQDLLNSATDGNVPLNGNMPNGRRMNSYAGANGVMTTQSLCGPDGVNSVVTDNRRPGKCGCKCNDTNYGNTNTPQPFVNMPQQSSVQAQQMRDYYNKLPQR